MVGWLVGWLPLFNILNNYGITSFNTHAMSNPSLHLPSPHLRTHVNILSAPLEPSGSCSHFERLRGASSLDQAFRALQRSQKRWQVHCLRTARPPWRRRASSVQRSRGEPRGLERPFRTPHQSQDGSMSQTLAGAVFSRPDRVI